MGEFTVGSIVAFLDTALTTGPHTVTIGGVTIHQPEAPETYIYPAAIRWTPQEPHPMFPDLGPYMERHITVFWSQRGVSVTYDDRRTNGRYFEPGPGPDSVEDWAEAWRVAVLVVGAYRVEMARDGEQ